MPKIDIAAAPIRTGSHYPPPLDERCRSILRHKLGLAANLTHFGVNLLELPPGQWSSQRHWHSAQDEFVWVLQGEVVLVMNDGEHVLREGDCVGFPAGVADAHHFQNRSAAAARLLEVGSRRPDEDGCEYPDVDLMSRPGARAYLHRDGTPYRRE
jgi:uncharacterized cupin superfamily protein